MRPFPRLARLMGVSAKLLCLLTLCAAMASIISAPSPAAPPPLPLPTIPDPAQERARTQLMIQQAQAEQRLAASQAQVQARLDANQARLEAQLAAEQAGAQARLEGAGNQVAAAAALPELSWLNRAPMQPPMRRAPGTMELTALTPQLGRYFGTDHGVLVVRAPAHGVLKLQDGDVILSIGGRVPASGSQAIRILTSYDPGERIRLVILREHRRMDITATLPAAPVPPAPPAPPVGP